MSIFNQVGDYFSLDIGTTAVRVVKLGGKPSQWSLQKYAIVPVDMRVSTSDAADDQRKLAEVITTAIGQSGIRDKNVILGVPSNRMFATVVELPEMPKSELASTIKYQAEQYIPMSLDEAKVDHAVLGKSANDPSKVEILLASVANSFSEMRLDMIEGMGLNVLAMEPDSLALTRALLPADVSDGRLIVEVGDSTTDVVLAYDNAPRLIRSIPTGMQAFVKAATQNLNIQANQASQFILKFGVQPDKLEGQIFRALEATLDQFASELEKSITFFRTKYPSVQIGSIIVSNYGVSIPSFGQYLASKLNLRAEFGNPWQHVSVSPADQTKLQPLSSQFAVAIGLAQRGAGE
jgi:type IV pilus assembly protein PilM